MENNFHSEFEYNLLQYSALKYGRTNKYANNNIINFWNWTIYDKFKTINYNCCDKDSDFTNVLFSLK